MSPLSRHVELIVRRSGDPDRRMVLAEGVSHLGRAEDNELVLADIGVSRRHARITVEPQQVKIEDLGSGNGTFVRSRRIDQHVIAGEMTVLVVDSFKEIDIHHQDRERRAVAGTELNLVLKMLAQAVPVLNAGQRVNGG
jgi:pSer/pThr/pTyr-binding forkhead associated (FHA) protein